MEVCFEFYVNQLAIQLLNNWPITGMPWVEPMYYNDK